MLCPVGGHGRPGDELWAGVAWSHCMLLSGLQVEEGGRYAADHNIRGNYAANGGHLEAQPDMCCHKPAR